MADTSSAVDKIKEMLSDPQQMEKLGPILEMLTNGRGSGAANQESPGAGEENPPDGGAPSYAPPTPQTDAPDAGRASGGLNMDTMLKIKSLYDSVNSQDDRRINLLMAVKPYLRSSRLSKLDTAVKILRVTKIGSAMKDLDQL